MEGYEKFKEQVMRMTGLDLSLYKERQMKRRIESLIKRHQIDSYETILKSLRATRKYLMSLSII